jgi:hypothetical protein
VCAEHPGDASPPSLSHSRTTSTNTTSSLESYASAGPACSFAAQAHASPKLFAPRRPRSPPRIVYHNPRVYTAASMSRGGVEHEPQLASGQETRLEEGPPSASTTPRPFESLDPWAELEPPASEGAAATVPQATPFASSRPSAVALRQSRAPGDGGEPTTAVADAPPIPDQPPGRVPRRTPVQRGHRLVAAHVSDRLASGFGPSAAAYGAEDAVEESEDSDDRLYDASDDDGDSASRESSCSEISPADYSSQPPARYHSNHGRHHYEPALGTIPSLSHIDDESPMSRGYSPDCAVPPPIGRVKEHREPTRRNLRERSKSLADRLKFSMPAMPRVRSTLSRSQAKQQPSPEFPPHPALRFQPTTVTTITGGSQPPSRKSSFSFASIPARLSFDNFRHRRRSSVASSVETVSLPYSAAREGRLPTMTSNAADLLPVSRHWRDEIAAGGYEALEWRLERRPGSAAGKGSGDALVLRGYVASGAGGARGRMSRDGFGSFEISRGGTYAG